MAAVEKIETATPPAVATKPERQIIPVAVDINNPVSLYLDTGVFEQLQRVAKLMASSTLIPAHLRGMEKTGDCFLVVSQAFRWGMDPFAVAQHTYVLQGKLGYEGKLIAAVVNTNARIERHLSYAYEGSGADRKVTVSGTLKGETEARTISGTVGGWKTNNEKWASMPDQMLAYRGAREWARRHMPEAVLGVSADEELAEIDGGDLERDRDGNYRPARPQRSDYYGAPIDVQPTAGNPDANMTQTVSDAAQPKEALFDELPQQLDPKWQAYLEKQGPNIDECETLEDVATVRDGFKTTFGIAEVPATVQHELMRQLDEREKAITAKGKRR